jgi:hypothetical protein
VLICGRLRVALGVNITPGMVARTKTADRLAVLLKRLATTDQGFEVCAVIFLRLARHIACTKVAPRAHSQPLSSPQESLAVRLEREEPHLRLGWFVPNLWSDGADVADALQSTVNSILDTSILGTGADALLVTGATGYLGIFIVEEFLKRMSAPHATAGRPTTLLLLVRAPSASEARDRVQKVGPSFASSTLPEGSRRVRAAEPCERDCVTFPAIVR